MTANAPNSTQLRRTANMWWQTAKLWSHLSGTLYLSFPTLHFTQTSWCKVQSFTLSTLAINNWRNRRRV